MSDRLLAAYRRGTFRLVTPEETLESIRPKLRFAGITRCADVTGLDDLGIQTCCAIRPMGSVLQVSNGKGLTKAAAQASALMEAIELWHAENAPSNLKMASTREMVDAGLEILSAASLPGFDSNRWSDQWKLHWIEGKECLDQRSIWVPASVVYFDCFPAPFQISTNGLASGNHEVEATLHALYELVERDTHASVQRNASVHPGRRFKVVDPSTIDVPGFPEMLGRIRSAATELIVAWVQSCIPVHTFWACLINRAPFSDRSAINLGWGTHGDRDVALWRAVTEAAQSRAALIHGSREDLDDHRGIPLQVRNTDRISAQIGAFRADVSWSECLPQPRAEGEADIAQCLDFSLEALSTAGRGPIVMLNLSRPEIGIPVVRLIAPNLRNPQGA